jgi:hypothetical protein
MRCQSRRVRWLYVGKEDEDTVPPRIRTGFLRGRPLHLIRARRQIEDAPPRALRTPCADDR